MLVGVAVAPSTPLLLLEESPLAAVAAQVDRVLAGLRPGEVTLVLAGGTEDAVVAWEEVVLAGFGLPGGARITGHEAAARQVADAWHLPIQQRPPGADLTCLALLAARLGPLVLVELATPQRGPSPIMGTHRIVASGDLAAGHGPKPPRPEAAAVAAAFDEQAVAAVESGRAARLERLAPLAGEAHARGWAALLTAVAAAEEARLGLVLRWTGAPYGVGLLVAGGT